MLKTCIDALKEAISCEKLAAELYACYAEVIAEPKAKDLFLEAFSAEVSHAYLLEKILANAEQSCPEIKEELLAPDFHVKKNLEVLLRKAPTTSLKKALEYTAWLEHVSLIDEAFTYFVETLASEKKLFTLGKSLMQDHFDMYAAFFNEYEGGSYKHLWTRKPFYMRRILVVDDLEPNRRLLATVLSHDYDVETASDGREALKQLEHAHYDLVFSDMEMPYMDGEELYYEAHKIGVTNFVFHTGYSDRSFFQQQRVPILPKPSPLNEIRAIVKKHLKKCSPGGSPSTPS